MHLQKRVHLFTFRQAAHIDDGFHVNCAIIEIRDRQLQKEGEKRRRKKEKGWLSRPFFLFSRNFSANLLKGSLGGRLAWIPPNRLRSCSRASQLSKNVKRKRRKNIKPESANPQSQNTSCTQSSCLSTCIHPAHTPIPKKQEARRRRRKEQKGKKKFITIPPFPNPSTQQPGQSKSPSLHKVTCILPVIHPSLPYE